MDPLSEKPRLVPATIKAQARSRGRWSGAFGPRFFIALILGLVWVGPAWWNLRYLFAMAVWDALLMLAWLADWRHLPQPGQIEVSRTWNSTLSQAHTAEITLGIRFASKSVLHVRLEDDLPTSLLTD